MTSRLRFASLGSGSRGNCLVVQSGESCILIDCGFSLRETEKRLRLKRIEATKIQAIFVTHEHSDHRAGIGVFGRRHAVPVYATQGTLSRIDITKCLVQPIRCGVPVQFNDFVIHPVAVPHDAHEPSQFVIECASRKLGILTDTGCTNSDLVARYRGCNSLFVEANHDVDMLWNGPYPYSLKQRVAGDLGHLSNEQTHEFIHAVRGHELQSLVLAHLSQQNNCTDIVDRMFAPFREYFEVQLATQENGTDWIQVA